jgi:hypothetical protein
VGSATVPVALASVSPASLQEMPTDGLLGETPSRAGETCLRRGRGRQAPALPPCLGVGATLWFMAAMRDQPLVSKAARELAA